MLTETNYYESFEDELSNCTPRYIARHEADLQMHGAVMINVCNQSSCCIIRHKLQMSDWKKTAKYIPGALTFLAKKIVG